MHGVLAHSVMCLRRVLRLLDLLVRAHTVIVLRLAAPVDLSTYTPFFVEKNEKNKETLNKQIALVDIIKKNPMRDAIL